MRASWKLGQVAGIDLYLHPTFLLLLAYIGMTHHDSLGAILLTSAVFGCVVLHELGHALTARRFGIGTEDITLYPIGGVARLERMPRAPGAELLIALAGPAVNVALALGFLAIQIGLGAWGAWEDSFLALPWLSVLMTINLGLAVFNLIPAFPMDGGRVMRALLSGWLGRVKATEVAAHLGQAIAIVFGVYCLMSGSLLQAALAGFIFLAAQAELGQVYAEEHLRRRHRSRRANGVWVAPPGYSWVSRGPGVWQLEPIVVISTDSSRPTPSPWR